MGAFQGAFTKIIGGAMTGKLLEEKRAKAMQNVQDIKMAKLNKGQKKKNIVPKLKRVNLLGFRQNKKLLN